MASRKILVNAVYRDGTRLFEDRNLITEISAGRQDGVFGIVELRIVLPKKDMDGLMNGLKYGQVELVIDGVPLTMDLVGLERKHGI